MMFTFRLFETSILTSRNLGLPMTFRSFSVHITLAVLELKENGQLHELEQTWWLEKGQCGDPQSQSKVRGNTDPQKTA